MYWGMQHPVFALPELKVDKLSLYSKIINIRMSRGAWHPLFMRLRKDMVKKWLKYTITEK